MMPDRTDRSLLEMRRRAFLLGGSGLALGLVAGGCTKLGFGAQESDPGNKIGAFIEIGNDGHVTIVTPGAEMGQGVSSSLPKIVAEELGADWAKVEVRLSGVNPAFNDPRGRQRSANSDAVTSYFEPLRKVGASAREMLVAAAAARWQVDPATIKVENGVLTNSENGQELNFGDVAEDAAKLPIPEEPKLKDAKDFTLIGKVGLRKDIPAKVFGTSVFGMDLDLPDMLYAAVKHVPVAGAVLAGFDAETAKGMAGVREIVPLENAIAVIADSYWQAQQAVDTIELKESAGERVDTDELMKTFRTALDDDDNTLPFPVGGTFENLIMSAEQSEIDKLLARAPIKFEQEYSVPYLAHATMEPMCATALIESDRCEIWAPTQAADRIPPEVAAATGLLESAITIHRTFIGGGFGRKNERDFIIQATLIAQAKPGRPVMLVWSREQDTQHDYYRPATVVRSRAALKSDGTILAIHGRAAGQTLTTGVDMRWEGFADATIVGGMLLPDYDMGTSRIDMVEVPAPIRTGYWRSVSLSNNGFFAEAVINDIAAQLGRDPLEYRLELLRESPRAEAVIKLAAEKAGWGRPKLANVGHGIAFTHAWNSHCAQVVEVTVTGKQVVVNRIVCAFDCGTQVEPDNVAAQIEGGIVFGLSAALFGKINFRDGAVVEQSFADYPVVTMANMPEIEIHMIKSEGEIGGVGEAGVPAVAPALTAAIFDATGDNIRNLPITESGYEVPQ